MRELSDVLEYKSKLEEKVKEKKIFVKFRHSNNHRRCEWTHGYMGEETGSSFQFFIGYKVMEPSQQLLSMGEKQKYVANYYTLIRNTPKNATASHDRLGDTNYQEGTKLEPLHFPQERSKFEATYAILDWTQEAEDYLRSIQDKFKELNSYLDNFLGNMSNEKLQKLMESSEFKMLTGGEQ